MKIAIHQPNYLPWPGYFKKMSLCDVFVFLDDVQLNKESYTRRIKIRHPESGNEFAWLTVPLMKYRIDEKISHLRIDQRKDWIASHLGLISHAYRNKPGWKTHGAWVEKLLSRGAGIELLADLNIFLIKEIAAKLAIQCRFTRSSEIPVSGKADSYTYAIVKELGGKTYIRGMGEQRYANDPRWAEDRDLDVVNIDYEQELQSDPAGTWRKGYSVIDLMLRQEQDPDYFG